MKRWLVDLLRCPACGSERPFDVKASAENSEITTGILRCAGCGADFPVVDGIPRFVGPEQNYTDNFGAQWRRFRTTQIDRLAGHKLSETRFFQDTRWPKASLAGKLILDAGCGAGRFTDVMAQHGARVVACDSSRAVDAVRETARDPSAVSSTRGEIEVVKCDLLALPFRTGVFDAVHCAGVIQHLPDPERVMRTLPALVRSGGRIFYNFYEIDPWTKCQVVKYLLRRTTPDWPAPRLFKFCRWLCRLLFMPSLVMSRIPKVRFFNRFLPICSVHPAGIPLAQQYELTLLDTIDWYGPRYEIRQNHLHVAALLKELGANDVASAPGLAWAIKAS